jgi:hypothetical protein
VIVDRLELRETPTGMERSARVRWGAGEATVAIAAPSEFVLDEPDASPFVPALLLPAMCVGEDLEVDGPVSAQLVRGAEGARELYAAWASPLSGGELRVATERAANEGGHEVAGFFSRGVDSTYSATVPRTLPAALTSLLFVDGLEPMHDETVRREEIRLAGEAAERIGLPLIVAHTNLRALTDRFVRDWEDMAGGGLAFAALALAGGIGTALVPSSDSAATIGPCGVSPLLDPLFSTERLRIHHDSVAPTRVEKVIWLANERPDLARGLKVCFAENRVDNCGHCSKCLLTMGSLEAAGRLSEADFFPHEIDIAEMEATRIGALQPRVEFAELVRSLDPARQGPLRDAILAAMARAPTSPSGTPPPSDTPAFRRRHGWLVRSLIREGRPWPPPEGWQPRDPPLVGLVRTVARDAGRHLYGAGTVPRGEPAGELGALLAEAAGDDAVALRLTPDGLAVIDGHEPTRPRAGVVASGRWALAPLGWGRDDAGVGERARAALRRMRALAAPATGAPVAPTGPPAGYLHRDAADGRLPLYSAVHAVTGDQLLTTNRWESVDLGYGEPELLGYLEPEAPVTGRLGLGRPRVPWAARFGQRVRT